MGMPADDFLHTGGVENLINIAVLEQAQKIRRDEKIAELEIESKLIGREVAEVVARMMR